jgi:hypothetical protein
VNKYLFIRVFFIEEMNYYFINLYRRIFMKKLTTILLAIMLIVAMSMTGEAKKRVLIESFTGTWCGPCGVYGKPATEEILTTYAGDVYVAEIHAGSGDPFNIPEYNILAGAFGITGIPGGLLNREPVNVNGQVQFSVYPTSWKQVVPSILASENVVDVNLFYSINQSTRQLSATIEATFLKAVSMTGGELRFNVYICESNIVGYQNGQGNDYNHKHVCRKMLGGAWGTSGIIPSSVSAGAKYTYTYTFTLDPSWKINDLEFYGTVAEYHASDASQVQILNAIKGVQGAPSSELTSTGPSIMVKPTGTPFSKTFQLKNIGNESITFRINEEVSSRTPSDWTYRLITPSGIVNKNEKTQSAEVTLAKGATADITLELTPGATLGIGDLSIEVFNKFDLTGQRSNGKITAASAEISNLQVNDYDDAKYSILTNMNSAGLTSPVEISASEFEDIGASFNNLSVLVWNCGEKGSLTASEANKINSAINDGVNVFMLGTIIANSTDNAVKSMLNYAGVQFIKQVFQGVGDGKINIIGYKDDPISNGFDQPCTLINYLAPGLKATGSTAVPFLRFKNVDSVVAIRSTLGDTKIIVMGLNPMAITNTYERNSLVNKCLQWLQGVGPAISCAENLSFTSTEAGQTSEKTLTIENKGKSPLTVTDIEVEYEFSTNFMVKGNKSFTIPANSTYDLILQFKPSYAIQYDSWIRIYSNAENAPIKQVNVTGIGKQATAGPVISLSVQNLSFSNVGVGSSDSKTFRINNTGNQELNVTNITVPGAYAPLFTIDQTAFTVAAGANKTVTVTFNPTEVVSIETNLTITSNNKSGAVQLPITANAIVGVEDALQASQMLNVNAVPNPFTENSRIEFTLNGDMSRQVAISVIDAAGRTVKQVSDKTFEPGTYTFDLNSSNLSSGTYYIVAKTNGYTEQLQIVVVK